MITILYRKHRQTLLFALNPILKFSKIYNIEYFSNIEDCLQKGKNTNVLLIIGYFKSYNHRKLVIDKWLLDLREKFSKIALFDDSDGADSLHPELLHKVDLYFKKQLLTERKNYLRPMYGRQLFSDYYHINFGATDSILDERNPVLNEGDLDKLYTAWNLGVNSLSTSRISNWSRESFVHLTHLSCTKKMAIKKGSKRSGVQARFSHAQYPNSIGFQRRQLNNLLQGKGGVLQDRISKRKFRNELNSVKGVLSPFGFGEITHRDFEAVRHLSVLIKPSMTHIETYPNIFKNHTYVPLNWDFSNLDEVIEDVLAGVFDRIPMYALDNLHSELTALDEKVCTVLDLLLD